MVARKRISGKYAGMSYPHIKAVLIEPGALVLSVSLFMEHGAPPIPLIVDRVVESVEEAHDLIRPLAEAHGVPAESVEIDNSLMS